MKMTKISVAIAAATLFSAGAQAGALDDLSINGFGTIGGTYMEGEDRTLGIKDGIDKEFSYKEDTKIGVQVRYRATDSLSFAAQAKVDALNEEYKPKLTWAYGSYQVNDALTIRAGRLSTPLYLKSDTLDIGYSYPWIRTPMEVYGQVTLNTFEGIDVLYSVSAYDLDVDFQAFVGTVLEQDLNILGNSAELTADKAYGLSATIPFDYGFLRIAHGAATGMDVTIDGIMAPYNEIKDIEGTFTSVGGQVNYENLLLLGEFGLREGPSGGGVSEQEGYYLTAGYQVTPSILPHITYSTVKDKASGGDQTSVTAGVRYDVYPGVSVKAEYSRVKADGYPGFYDASGLTNLAISRAMPEMLSAESDVASLAVDFVF